MAVTEPKAEVDLSDPSTRSAKITIVAEITQLLRLFCNLSET